MYIPKINLATDHNEIISFMQRFSFATIITAKDNLPVATHLPFLINRKDDKLILSSHFARANEQWKDIENNKVLVIFSEPHAYISPSHYDSKLSVPTWNYISVHAYGQAELINEQGAVMQLLEATIDEYETAYQAQWSSLPLDFRTKMSKGIVAFQVKVEELQAKKKLSQNKTEAEQSRIIETLSKSTDTNEQLIAEHMAQTKLSK
jgi:transcriptional regulator